MSTTLDYVLIRLETKTDPNQPRLQDRYFVFAHCLDCRQANQARHFSAFSKSIQTTRQDRECP